MTKPDPVRIALWSGPRNVSTALMRAWENRPDTEVWDEPFYAYYLAETGADHPLRETIIQECEPDPEAVLERMLEGGPPHRPDATAPPPVFYQKQMAHHLVGDLDLLRDDRWTGLRHGFLIRDPRDMLPSLGQKLESFDLDATGFPQQVRIFRAERERIGRVPPVVDSRDVLTNPEGILRKLCASFGVEFDPVMLQWPAGPRDSDGVWASHWYDRVVQTTGFEPYRPKDPAALTPELQELEAQCRELYDELWQNRITP